MKNPNLEYRDCSICGKKNKQTVEKSDGVYAYLIRQDCAGCNWRMAYRNSPQLDDYKRIDLTNENLKTT